MRCFFLAVAASVVFSSSVWAQRNDVTFEPNVEYGRAGDVSLKLDVVLPKIKSEKPRPAVVWIHGGAWRAGDKSSGQGHLAPLVASGDYVGFSIAYRFSNVAKWPAQIHDCKAAIRFIRANAEKYGVNADKIGVMGQSAGGHLVSMLGASGDVQELEGENGSPGKSSRVTCVVDLCGPSDFVAFAKSKESRAIGSPEQLLLGGTLEEKPDAFKNASPVTHVTADDAPFLILHGTADNIVPLEQAELLHAALEKAGVKSKLVKLDGQGHSFGGPEVHREITAFLAEHLK